MSWGSPEFQSEFYYDSNFITPSNHQGVSFVAGTGDAGVLLYPSAAPTVLAVGGTSLYLNSGGGYGSETTWNDKYGSGGGGVSTQEPEPIYQSKVQQTGWRTVPDVAYNADPNTGFAAIVGGQNVDVGGTSCGAPQWAALIAVADQGRATNGYKSLDSSDPVNGLLPDLYDLYNTPQYSQAFNDVTTGTTSTGQAAGPGYDTATGLGTPKAGFLIPYLAQLNRPPSNYNQDVVNNTGAAQNTITVVLAGDQTANLGARFWNWEFSSNNTPPTVTVSGGNTYLTFTGTSYANPGVTAHVGYSLLGGTTEPHGNGSPDVIATYWGLAPTSNPDYNAPAATVDVNIPTPAIGPYTNIVVLTDTSSDGNKAIDWHEITIAEGDSTSIDITNAEQAPLEINEALYFLTDEPIPLDDLNKDFYPETFSGWKPIPGITEGIILSGGTLQSDPIPEPTALALAAIGALGLMKRRVRRSSK